MPDVGRFPSIDRFAEKYAFQSPYTYAANNPIKYIDVNGDSVWIAHKGNNYLYDNGNLFNSDGTEYIGKVKGFLKQTVKVLNKLNETDEGSSILSDLSQSENNFTIERGLNRFLPDDHGSYGINIVTNNTYALQVLEQGELLSKHLPFTQIGDGGTIYWQGDGAISLGHELAHAHDANYGLLDTRTTEINRGRAEIREIRAVYKENRIRGQMGKRLRKNYSGGPSLLDSNKQPVNYINPFLFNLMNAIR
ncbi:MAG TPA: M91 family zinc metallopeptidase [Saprospiraceae bacterium]|nr:M91 family zinc metallopeptidase [Saprospiraceae bacterium]